MAETLGERKRSPLGARKLCGSGLSLERSTRTDSTAGRSAVTEALIAGGLAAMGTRERHGRHGRRL